MKIVVSKEELIKRLDEIRYGLEGLYNLVNPRKTDAEEKVFMDLFKKIDWLKGFVSTSELTKEELNKIIKEQKEALKPKLIK